MYRVVDDQAIARNGVQALETGLRVLDAFVDAEPLLQLKTVAERADMHPAKVHRYLASLCRAGFVEQDVGTARYRLGQAALRLGFAAMTSVDVLRVARPRMASFAHAFGHSAMLAIWGGSGPTVALQELVQGPITITASVGSPLPLLRSSTGRTFAAWLPCERTAAMLREELAYLRGHPQVDSPKTMAEAELLLEDTRRRGLARAVGQVNAAVHALSAPIFDGKGDIVAVLSAIGPVGRFDSTWSGPVAIALRQAARSISEDLGHTDAKRK
jgi:DNA-binding IclR family transcriptional regulator